VLAPPNIYFIDLTQIEAHFHRILTEMTNIDKIHVQQKQGRHFTKSKKNCRIAPQRPQGLGCTICRCLPVINRSSAAICR
jgi:hypothetical protein